MDTIIQFLQQQAITIVYIGLVLGLFVAVISLLISFTGNAESKYPKFVKQRANISLTIIMLAVGLIIKSLATAYRWGIIFGFLPALLVVCLAFYFLLSTP